MNLEQQVNDGIKKAMLARDQESLRGLRAIKSAILNAKTSEGFNGEINEAEEIKLLQKLVKQRKDSLEIYEKQSREDLAEKERAEINVIEQFLPKQLDATEIKNIIQQIVKETGATSPADMGKVMAAANKQLAGKADGKTIAGVVKEILTT
ncbi:MAG: GatB/YqeY domain-containing protein [Bacteroidetes bacterium]|nr:GatB/YqeY domain-containing protein [Bacteroidota bacterium]